MNLTYEALAAWARVFATQGNSRLSVLFELAVNRKGLPMTKLSTQIGVAAASLHGVLNRMWECGLVEKTDDDDDGRRRLYRLTAEGRKESQKLRRQVILAVAAEMAKEESLI